MTMWVNAGRHLAVPFAVLALIGAACSSGGSSGGAPDGGSGSGGSGGSGGAKPTHELSAEVSECRGGGLIRYTPPEGTPYEKTSISPNVEEGTQATIEAVPYPGSIFRGWQGDCTDTEPCTLTMDGPKNVVAEFAPKLSDVWGSGFVVEESTGGPLIAAFGPNGELAAVVSFNGKIVPPGGSALESNSGLAILAYEPDRTLRWSRLFSRSDLEIAALRWVGSELVLVGTRMKSSVTIDGFSLSGVYRDALVAKLDAATGTATFATDLTPDNSEQVDRAAISASGRIALVGRFWEPGNVGGADMTEDPSFDRHDFIGSYDATLTHQWSGVLAGSNTFSRAYDVDIDESGVVALAGAVQETLQLPGTTLTSAPDNESPFLAAFASDGAPLFAKVFEVAGGSNEAEGVRLTQSGDLLAAFSAGLAIDLGAGPLEPASSSAGRDLVLGRFTSTGQLVWGKRFTTAGSEDKPKIALSGDSFFVTGELGKGNDDTDFGTGPVHASSISVFLSRHSAANGEIEWVRTFGCDGWDKSGSVTAWGDTACITADFEGTIDYGGMELGSGAMLICGKP